MSCIRVFFCCLLFACRFLVTPVGADEPQEESFTQQQLDRFENKVRPILVRRCNECHSGDENEGGLSLQSRKAMLVGGETGAAIVPGDAEGSLLIQAIHYGDVYEMPPDSKLPDEEIKILEDWIRDSAPWPQHSDVEIASAGNGFDIESRKQEHWCWQPVSPPEVPELGSPSQAIDFLLNSKLAEKKLKPNDPASRSALLRRISFDLTGLPPSQDLVQKYVVDESMQVETVVDELLESSSFGERWARHWMDLARYAETHGHEFDYPILGAWKYRDYLIRAFNEDLPYDQFVTEHIAGDLLDAPRLNPESKFNESVLATGFWFLGEATHAPVDSKEDEAKRIDNQIDVMCRSFIGLTVACARCHDHKFDAISTKDYYAMSGYLQSSRRLRTVVDNEKVFENATVKVKPLRDEIVSLTEDFRRKISQDEGQAANRLAEFLTNDKPRGKTHLRRAIKASPPEILNHPKQGAFNPDLHDDRSNTEFPLGDANWKTSGFAFADSSKLPIIASQPLQWLHPNTISSASNGLRFAGTAHSSTFEVKHKFIHVRMKAKNARVELVVDGFRMHEHNALLFNGLIHKDVNHEEFKWLTIGRELYLHLGNRAWLEFYDGGEGYFAVDRVVFSPDGRPPRDEAPDFATRWKEQRDSNHTVRAKTIFRLAVDAMDGPHANEVMSWILKHEFDGIFDAGEIGDKIRRRTQQLADIGQTLPLPSLAYAMTEGFPEDEYVFVRGNHKTLGEVAPRQFLTAIVGDESSRERAQQSGRMRLAQQIVDPANPLTSRVIVNRVWHHLFGRGIVRSVDNFGVLGETPSHPELLDHLADEFVKDGWSIKRLIRKLMLTEAYRRSSTPSVASRETDPENVFLHRANVRRLQGEAIRDSMLASSGRLDKDMFGPSVRIHMTPFMKGRGRPSKSGKLDGQGRRSIYVETRRNFLSPMMLAFDTPIPFNAIGQRSVSNVPAQALILMNDPFVLQQAGKFAKRVVNEADGSEDRIKFIYQIALSRMPLEDEIEKAKAFIQHHAERLEVDQDSTEVWKDFCHVMFNTKEFIYLN